MTTAKPRNIKLDCLGILFVILAAFLGGSLIGNDPADGAARRVYPPNPTPANWCGPAGAEAAAALTEIFGAASLFLVVALTTTAVDVFRRLDAAAILWRLLGALMLLLGGAALLHRAPILFLAGPAGAGGSIGAITVHALDLWLSFVGSRLLIFSTMVIGLLLFVDGLVQRLLAGVLATGRALSAPRPVQIPAIVKTFDDRAEEPPQIFHAPSDFPVVDDDSEDAPAVVEKAPKPWPARRVDLKINRLTSDEPHGKAAAESGARLAGSPFKLPGLDILDEIVLVEDIVQEEEIRSQAELMEKTFAEFQMRVKVVQIDMGPVVTQYEIELEPGLRARRVMALSDDLSIALRAPSVRIVAPIPGKNTVGIEVPNEKRAKVTLREVMVKSLPQAANMRLPVYLGKDVKGLPLVCDLANMPHLLIAGRTGTGKSVCLNALILSILMSRTPDQVKLLMIDPKMVELSQYKDVPHLMHPVVTDMKKAEALLGWAVEKMEERYALLARCGVRHIDAFNKLTYEERVQRVGEADEQLRRKLAFILIFADEMADLMMTSAKEVETHIIRLAQKSRAVGIHLVLATQKPTVDVITGLIKSNLPARIAFQVASRTDSRVVLDEMGADKLLGNGDMLFLYPGTSKMIRAQGTYVSDEEVLRVTEYLSKQAKPEFAPELLHLPTRDTEDGPKGDPAERDEVYRQAVDLVVREQRGSVSLLQRGLGIGYGRAARLIDYMAEDGIVGPYSGSQAREVLYSPEQWEGIRRERWGLAG